MWDGSSSMSLLVVVLPFDVDPRPDIIRLPGRMVQLQCGSITTSTTTTTTSSIITNPSSRSSATTTAAATPTDFRLVSRRRRRRGGRLVVVDDLLSLLALGLCLVVVVLPPACHSYSLQQQHRKDLEKNQGQLNMDVGADADTQLQEEDDYDEEHVEQFMPMVMHPVSIQYFTKTVDEAKSFHDVLRIFYHGNLSNDAIEGLVMSQFGGKRHGQRHYARPRIGISNVMATAVDRPNFEEMENATRHAKQMLTAAECGKPIPEVVRIRDLVKSADRRYYPTCTIVHRCRKTSGCCNETAECGRKSYTTFTKHFWVFLHVVNRSENIQLNATQYVESFDFENHTACECKPVKQLPECPQCPMPFRRKRLNDTQCVCDCQSPQHRTCQRMKKGREMFTQRQLECIKRGVCHVPLCEYGVFDEQSIRIGRCPWRSPDRSSELNQSGSDAARPDDAILGPSGPIKPVG